IATDMALSPYQSMVRLYRAGAGPDQFGHQWPAPAIQSPASEPLPPEIGRGILSSVVRVLRVVGETRCSVAVTSEPETITRARLEALVHWKRLTGDCRTRPASATRYRPPRSTRPAGCPPPRLAG